MVVKKSSKSIAKEKLAIRKPVILLLGGGIDSTVMVDMYSKRKTPFIGIHYDYGQKALLGERKSIRLISDLYRFKYLMRSLNVPVASRGDEFLARNALFILSAAAEFGSRPTRIAFGAHLMSPYYDCSPRFVDSIQSILEGYFSGTVVLEAPLLAFTKAEIVAYAKKRRIPLKATFSCTRASRTPCSHCPSCLDRRALGV